VDGLASPYTGLWLITVYWGTGPAHGVPPGLVVMVPDREEEASWDIIIGWWLSPLLVPVHEISQDKWILTRRCLPPGKVMILLGVLPR
jgi:hypothetical protein